MTPAEQFRRLICRSVAVIIIAAAAITYGAYHSQAHAAVTHAAAISATTSHGARALAYAEAHYTGCWYSWGGESCQPGFDCSGLVVKSVWQADHILLPRTTYEMLSSRLLYQISGSVARPGDLVFYGTGHVEILVNGPAHLSFGALESGTRVGVHHWNRWWHPTLAFRIR